MTTTEERQSPTAGQRAAKAGAKHLGRKIGWILGAKIGFWVAAVLVLLLLVMAAGAQVANQQQQTTIKEGGAGPGPCPTMPPSRPPWTRSAYHSPHPCASGWTPTGRSPRRRGGAPPTRCRRTA